MASQQSEMARRKVNVLGRPHGNKLRIDSRILTTGEAQFVLYDDSNTEVANCMSDNSLATWAFSVGGAFEVKFDYDLSRGDLKS